MQGFGARQFFRKRHACASEKFFCAPVPSMLSRLHQCRAKAPAKGLKRILMIYKN